MIALRTLGIICLILVLIAPIFDLIHYTKSKVGQTKTNRNNKRKRKIDLSVLWDYMILIIPSILLIIGLFSNSADERDLSLEILGIGYMFFILSSNNRIDIGKTNLFIATVCIFLTIAFFFVKQPSLSMGTINALNSIDTLIFPPIAYVFLHSARRLIKRFTGTFPITMFKGDKVGQFKFHFNRKTTYWDLTWSMITLFFFPMIVVYLSLKK